MQQFADKSAQNASNEKKLESKENIFYGKNGIPECLLDVTTLCWAAMQGNSHLMEQLILGGVDVNAQDYDLRTPLHIAVSESKPDIVIMLLKAGARVDKTDRWGKTPLNCAVEYSDSNMIRLLKEYDQSPAIDGDVHSSSAYIKATLFHAAQVGDLSALKNAWISGIPIDFADDNGRTCLHVACQSNQLSVVELLVSAGANVNSMDKNGHTPISISIKYGMYDILAVLRRCYASQDNDNVKLQDIYTAVKSGDLKMVKDLLKDSSFNVNACDIDARTLLHLSAREGHLDICSFLIELGADINAFDRWGNTPYSEAEAYGHYNITNYLKKLGVTEHAQKKSVLPAFSSIDRSTLNESLQYILRTICYSSGPWVFGEAYLPTIENGKVILSLSCSFHLQVQKSEEVSIAMDICDESTLFPSGINNNNDLSVKLHQLSSVFLFDSGYGHVGRVYKSKETEWLSPIDKLPQSEFFFAPIARREHLETLLTLPMLQEDGVAAVFSFYSKLRIKDDIKELQRIQCLLISVSIMAQIKKDRMQNSNFTLMSRYKYFQALENAITCHGLLIADKETKDFDTILLALQWHLFDIMDKYATSMESEEHLAVIDLLSALVKMDKTCILSRLAKDDEQYLILLSKISFPIRTKEELFVRVLYSIRYLWTVSPPEGKTLILCEKMLSSIGGTKEKEFKKNDPQEEIVSCVLCRYKVPGHLHEGKLQIPSTKSIVSNTSPVYFIKISSPILKCVKELAGKLNHEFMNYDRYDEIMNIQLIEGSFSPSLITARDVYDTIGSAHSNPLGGQAQEARTSLINIVNQTIESKERWSINLLIKMHNFLDLEDSSHKGQIRTSAAVGFASSQIYRVFLPAEEIKDALSYVFDTLYSSEEMLNIHPLVAAFYMFSVLVYFIHPFQDGNGRIARLVGNQIAKKNGFPMVFHYYEKTVTFHAFLGKVLRMMDLVENGKQRPKWGSKDRTSAWF